MAKRLFDLVFSIIILTLSIPILIIVFFSIKLSSKGPVLYTSLRAGRGNLPFKIYKFRTMHYNLESGNPITKINDSRIFKIGRILRASKIDELPQFINVIVGNMSIVGPRPESIDIVNKYYNFGALETLKIKPGLVSPGSLFNYTHAYKYLDDEKPEHSYVNNLLPIKIALEKVYLKNASFIYDLKIIFQTIKVILLISFGKKTFPMPMEYHIAKNEHYI